jgi:hypothetical protein
MEQRFLCAESMVHWENAEVLQVKIQEEKVSNHLQQSSVILYYDLLV